jgi:phospholipase/carboxylesterase
VVVSVDAPFPSPFGRDGRQWFSVAGVTEENRPGRVAEAMPAFLAAVRHWQADSGVAAARTTLLGFSQGAIMALEATQAAQPSVATRVIAIAGRFGHPPRYAAAGVRFHIIHGDADPVIAPRDGKAAAQWIAEQGGSARLHMLAGLGHGIDARVARLVLQALQEFGGPV